MHTLNVIAHTSVRRGQVSGMAFFLDIMNTFSSVSNVNLCLYFSCVNHRYTTNPHYKGTHKLVKKSATYKWCDLGIELLDPEDLHALDKIQKDYPRDV